MNPLRPIGDFITNLLPANTATYTAPAQAPAASYNVRGVKLSDQDLSTLRNVLFAEISNRAPDKQALEARTIINTALNRVPQYQAQGKMMSLNDVLTSPNQYQGYGSPEYHRIANNATTTTDGPKLKAIDTTLSQLKTGNFPDTTDGRVYYSHDPAGQIWLKDGNLFKQPAAPRTVAALNQ